MADLRIDNPKTTEEFVAALAALNVKLPLRPSEEEVGVVIDAADRAFLLVDPENIAPDAEVAQIARWVILAVNTCGGFKAERA